MKYRRMRWARHVVRMGQMRDECKILVGKPAGNRPLGRPERIREDNIRMDLNQVEVWTGSVWFRTGISGGRL
jgi:hypothetical protein